MFISRKENGGLGFSQQYGLNVQYEVIPQRLFIGAEGVYAHISSSLWKNFHYNAFSESADIHISCTKVFRSTPIAVTSIKISTRPQPYCHLDG